MKMLPLYAATLAGGLVAGAVLDRVTQQDTKAAEPFGRNWGKGMGAVFTVSFGAGAMGGLMTLAESRTMGMASAAVSGAALGVAIGALGSSLLRPATN